MSEVYMNNCKAEPIHGEQMLRDPMKDVRELSLVADQVSDKTVKAALTLAIKRILERDFGVDFDRDVEVVGAAVEGIKTGGLLRDVMVGRGNTDDCRQAYEDMYHKVKRDVSYDTWVEIYGFIKDRLTK